MACNLGRQIRLFRRAKGMSGEELAFRSQLSSRGLNDIELGKSDPKFTTVEKIAAALSISIEDLVNENHYLIIDFNGTASRSK